MLNTELMVIRQSAGRLVDINFEQVHCPPPQSCLRTKAYSIFFEHRPSIRTTTDPMRCDQSRSAMYRVGLESPYGKTMRFQRDFQDNSYPKCSKDTRKTITPCKTRQNSLLTAPTLISAIVLSDGHITMETTRILKISMALLQYYKNAQHFALACVNRISVGNA